MRLKLTDITIQKLPLGLPQKTYHDTLLENFAVRVGLRTKTFIVTLGRDRKRHTIGQYPLTTLQQARDQACELMRGKQRPEATTVSDAVDEYLRSLQIRPRTSYEYERILKRHLVPTIGSRSLHDIAPRDILSITDKLLHTPTECRHAHVAMQTFFNWCVPRYLTVSPMAGLRTPTKPKKRTRILSYDELAKVWKAAKTMGEFGSVIQLCILTGQRRGEISKLTSQNSANSLLTLPASLTKNKREHSLPLSQLSTMLLQNLNKPSINWGRKKNELDKLTGINLPWVIHDLRRTFASNLGDLNIAPHIIERLLNHAAPASLGGNLGITYNRAVYLNEQRKALELYERELQIRGVIT